MAAHWQAPEGAVVLGIDPGLESTGWGLVALRGGAPVWLAHGCISTRAADPMPARVDAVFRGLQSVARDAPALAAIAAEAWVPYGGARGAGANTLRTCGLVRALAIVHGVPCAEYTAQAIKGRLGGNRAAEKIDVQRAVMAVLGLAKLPRPNHAADALAAALVHLSAWGPSDSVVSASGGTNPLTIAHGDSTPCPSPPSPPSNPGRPATPPRKRAPARPRFARAPRA